MAQVQKTGFKNPEEEKIVEAKPKQKQLKVYEVKVEVQLPATLTYRVTAESPEQALEMAFRTQPIGVKHNLARKKNLKATVYEYGSLMIKLLKNLK